MNPKGNAFIQGNDSITTTKDVYSQKTLTQANTYTKMQRVGDATKQWLDDKMGDMDVNDIMSETSSAIGDSMKSSADGIGLDTAKASKKMAKVLGVPTSFKDLTQRQQGSILKKIDEYAGTKGVAVMAGGVYNTIKKGDVTTVSGYMDLMNNLAGNSGLVKLLDIESTAAIFTKLHPVMIDWGMYDLLQTYIDKLNESDEKNAALEEVTISAAKAGNFKATKMFAEKMGQARAFAVRTEIIRRLMMAYVIPEEETRSYAVLASELIAFFSWIDPNWTKDPDRNQFTSLWYFSQANETCRSVLSYAGSNIATYAVAGEFVSKKTVDAVITETFPILLKVY